MLLISTSFSFVRTVVAQNFRLVWVDIQSYICSSLLEVAHHFLELHQRSRERRQRSAGLWGNQIRDHPVVYPCLLIFASVPHRLSVPFGTVLKSKLDRESAQFRSALNIKHVTFFVL